MGIEENVWSSRERKKKYFNYSLYNSLYFYIVRYLYYVCICTVLPSHMLSPR